MWIESDYVTDYVESVMFLSADSGRAAEFLYKMIPVVSPETFLTEEEIMELLETAKREGGIYFCQSECKMSDQYESGL